MISRRDNLLIKPWEQRRYENHRNKVLTAVPAIDNHEPITRNHVLIKHKKHQKEIEKRAKIERDNFCLLKHLAYIMRTNRVDNTWRTPQPNFLNRVAMFENQSNHYKYRADSEEIIKNNIGRKGKCTACTPQKITKPTIPEERIPWEPEKLPLSMKIRSQSMIANKVQSATSLIAPRAPQERSKSCKSRIQTQQNKTEQTKGKINLTLPQCLSPNSVIFKRGCLKLAVNFPTDTLVKLQEKNTHKILFGEDNCFCRNVKTN